MSNIIADTAVAAVTAPGFEDGKSFCQRFARQVIQHAVGHKYDQFFKDTALHSAEAFKADGRYVIHQPTPGSYDNSQPGDLLYKMIGDGPSGHVMIRVPGNRVAENSVVHFNASNGADGRGFRDLSDIGHVDLIVRLV